MSFLVAHDFLGEHYAGYQVSSVRLEMIEKDTSGGFWSCGFIFDLTATQKHLVWALDPDVIELK